MKPNVKLVSRWTQTECQLNPQPDYKCEKCSSEPTTERNVESKSWREHKNPFTSKRTKDENEYDDRNKKSAPLAESRRNARETNTIHGKKSSDDGRDGHTKKSIDDGRDGHAKKSIDHGRDSHTKKSIDDGNHATKSIDDGRESHRGHHKHLSERRELSTRQKEKRYDTDRSKHHDRHDLKRKRSKSPDARERKSRRSKSPKHRDRATSVGKAHERLTSPKKVIAPLVA